MKYLNIEQARKNVEKYLMYIESSINIPLMIIESETREITTCFIFSYNSKEFIKTGNISSALAGNSPLFVNKNNGKIYQSGTAYPIEYYIDKFEKGNMEVFSEISLS